MNVRDFEIDRMLSRRILNPVESQSLIRPCTMLYWAGIYQLVKWLAMGLVVGNQFPARLTLKICDDGAL
jgi:hypothetical protein